MAGGYRKPSGDGLESVRDQFRKIRGRLTELEKASGTSLKSLVAQVQNALANLAAQVAAEISAQSYTRTQIDAKIASPGDISAGNVTATGALRASSVYSTILASDYRAVWVTGTNGQLGHVPSSAQFKQDIKTAKLDPTVVLALRLVTFRYIAAVEQLGDAAAVEWGLIAEEVHALGLTWMVDYDAEGRPFGIKFERIVLAVLPYLQNVEERLQTLEARAAAPE